MEKEEEKKEGIIVGGGGVDGERSVIDKSAEPCLVCGVPTSMLHLQVNACRACAAFFRRSVQIHKSYRCQKNKGTCDITVKTIGKPLCRYCRYKKCLQIGMKISRCREDEMVEDPKPSVQETMQAIEANPCHYVVDFAKIFQTVNLIFESRQPVPLGEMQNHTKDFCRILANFIDQTKSQGDLLPMEKINENLRIRFLETYFVKIAQLLNHFQPFAALEISDKLLLHKRFWQVFHMLERCYQTCQVYGNSVQDLRLVIDSFHVVDLNSLKQIEGQKIGTDVFLLPFIDKIKHVLIPIKKANITLFEMAYMSQIALWSCYDILGLTSNAQKVAEEMMNQTANNMHDYFIQELRMPYYATRQSQLFKIVHYAEFICRVKQQLLTAKEIFNFGDTAFAYCSFEQSYFDFINKQ